ncbi:MAG: hypothetical protein WBW33_04040 [Bryobacteraceae bacterium]
MALRILVLTIAIPFGCLSQSVTLELSSGVASPGTSVTLAMTLNSTGATPASAQWALEYATADFSSVTVTAGPAATDSGKTVTCNQASGVTTCMLWSMDATPIANGVVANVSVAASESSFANSSGVQLVNCLAASAAGDALTLSGQGGGVTLPQLVTANPNPVPVAAGVAVGQTTVAWNAPDSRSVEVHVGSATGTLFASGGSSGSAQTGDWVSNGMVFVLVDATTQAVLSATTVTLAAPAPPTIAANPIPIPVATGAVVGQTTISWYAPGSSSVEIHVGSATGTLFAAGGSSGSATTGEWASNGMVFVLVDATTQAVLATTTVTQAQP